MSEARQLAEKRTAEITAMPADALIRLVEHPVETEITGPSGRSYRSKTYAFWDTEPYVSDLFVRVKVTGRGLRSCQRYYGVETRGPENEFDPGVSKQADVSPTWTEIAAWVIFALVIVTIPIGIGYLVSRLL
jgi:hypothetical protein